MDFADYGLLHVFVTDTPGTWKVPECLSPGMPAW
jgi:hypothetical protein